MLPLRPLPKACCTEMATTSGAAIGSPDETSSLIVTALRFARLGVHFLRAWVELAIVFPWLPPRHRAQRVHAWCTHFLKIARLEVRTESAAHLEGSGMLVANHISWLDMVVLQTLAPTRFIAKSEVRSWPIIGAIATRCGTVFVQRTRVRSTAEVSSCVASLLRQGLRVTVFPEGTTSDGEEVQKFHASLLQAPIDAGAWVQPVGLGYFDAGTGALCKRVAYVGDDTLTCSIWRTLRQRTVVCVRFGHPLDAQWWERRQLASELHRAVVSLRAQPQTGLPQRCSRV